MHAAVDTDLANRINNSYYNLNRSGLTEFHCTVSPNWKAAIQNLNTDAVGEEIIGLLEHTHFAVTVGPDGSSTIFRQTDATPSSEQVAARLRTVVAGFEQIITSFFQVWSQFTFHPIVPPGNNDFKLERSNDKYVLHQKAPSVEASSSLNADFMMTDTTGMLAGNQVTMHYDFGRQAGLYLFSGYDAEYPLGTGSVHQILTVAYQEVQGFELPSTVRMMVNQVVIPFDFRNYEIKKRE
jgi:hypothetical protein